MDGRGSGGFLNDYFYQGGFKLSILKGKHMEGGSGGLPFTKDWEVVSTNQ